MFLSHDSAEEVTHSGRTNLQLSESSRVESSLMLRPTVSRPVCLGTKHPSGVYDQIFITVGQLRICWCGALSLTRGRLSFTIAAGPGQRSYSRVRVPWGGLRFVTSLFVASYDSQGHGGSLLTEYFIQRGPYRKHRVQTIILLLLVYLLPWERLYPAVALYVGHTHRQTARWSHKLSFVFRLLSLFWKNKRRLMESACCLSPSLRLSACVSPFYLLLGGLWFRLAVCVCLRVSTSPSLIFSMRSVLYQRNVDD
jgi:hypothetical protein